MTAGKPKESGTSASLLQLLDDLGDPSWRVRQATVDLLARDRSPLLIAQLIDVVRHEHRNLSRLNAAIQVLTRTEVDVVPSVLELLGNSDADLRAYVALTLGERGDARAIPALVAALSDADTNVRTHAIEALGKLRAAEAVDALIQFVEELHFELAFPALDALAAIGDQRVAHRLIPLLQNPLLKTATVEALGALGGEEAVVELLKLLGDASVAPGTIAIAIQQIHARYVARYGSQAIAEIIRQSGVPASVAAFRSSLPASTAAESLAMVAMLGWLPGNEAEATLLDLLDSSDLRGASLNALMAKGLAVIPAVLDRFERSPRESQYSLIELCGRVADRQAVPLLLGCLGKEDEEAVAKSLNALARIGDERLYTSAKAFLGHPSASIRQAAVGALNSLGHPSTAADIQPLLQDPNPLVCESAVKVAAYFGFPECIDAVLACCNHSDQRVRRTAVEHLPCLDGDRIVAQLELALNSESPVVRAAAAGALGEIDARASIPLLVAALGDRDVWVRYYAVRSLAPTDYTAEARERLLSLAMDDPAMQVRIAATEALKGECLPALVELASSPEQDMVIAALRALGATGHPAALPTLARAASSTDPLQQMESIRALGALGQDGVIAPLREFALGHDRPFATEAIHALARIPSAAAIAVLLEALGVPANRPAATAALIRLGDAAVAVLACRLHQLPLDVRRSVVEVLSGIRSATAIEVLETVLADPEPAVRYCALSALTHVRCSSRQIPEAVGSEGNA